MRYLTPYDSESLATLLLFTPAAEKPYAPPKRRIDNMKANADPVIDEIVGSYRQLVKTAEELRESLANMLGETPLDRSVQIPRLMEVFERIDTTERELTALRNHLLLLQGDESIAH